MTLTTLPCATALACDQLVDSIDYEVIIGILVSRRLRVGSESDRPVGRIGSGHVIVFRKSGWSGP
jgi:hypothetical protein